MSDSIYKTWLGGTYRPRRWSPFIPGTEVSRAGFLIAMRNVWDSPLTKKNAFLSETLRVLTEPGVLNAAQIGALTGHSVRYVNQVAKYMNIKLPNSRAMFDPEMLPLLQSCLYKLASGEGVPRTQLEVLSQTTGPNLIEALIGVPRHAVWHVHNASRNRQLEELTNGRWG